MEQEYTIEIKTNTGGFYNQKEFRMRFKMTPHQFVEFCSSVLDYFGEQKIEVIDNK